MKAYSLFFLIILTFLVFDLRAQTKIIAHKSHSGKSIDKYLNHSFTIGDHWFSNFGAAPQKFIRNAHLDSVVYINDTTTVMFTSTHCQDLYDNSELETLWKAGKDTLINHPVFSQKIEVDSMKEIIKKQYYFKNKISDVKFIHFDKRQKNPNIQQDNNQQNNEQQNSLPSVFKNNTPDDTPFQKIFLFIAVVILSFVLGFIPSLIKKYT